MSDPALVPARPGWKDWLLFYLVWNCLALLLTAAPLLVILLAEPATAEILTPGFVLPVPRQAVHVLGAAALGGLSLAALAASFLVERVWRHVAVLVRPPADGFWRTIVGGILLMALVQAGWAFARYQLLPDLAFWEARSTDLQELIFRITGLHERNPWTYTALLLVVGLVVPVGEETLFRAVLFGGLRLRFGFLLAAVPSSVLFGLAHGMNAAIPTALMGLVLAWAMEREQNLWAPILLHILNNMVALVVLLQTG